MRKFYLMLMLIGCLFASCVGTQTNEEIISKEFKKYVQLKFDNPDDLKEIVEILPHDTLSYGSVHEITSKAIELSDLVREGYDLNRDAWENFMNELLKKLERYGTDGMTEYNRDKMYNLLLARENQIVTSLSQLVDMENHKTIIQKRLDSLTYHPAIYVYKINYRIRTNDSAMLKSHYSYIDSLDGFISITPEYNKKEVVCDEYNSMYNDVNKFIEITQKLGDEINASMENLKEARHIFSIEF